MFLTHFLTFKNLALLVKTSAKALPCDENQQPFKDSLHVPIGPITKARSKKIK